MGDDVSEGMALREQVTRNDHHVWFLLIGSLHQWSVWSVTFVNFSPGLTKSFDP